MMEKKEKVTSFLHKQDNGDKPSCRIMLQRSNMKWVQLLGYLIIEFIYIYIYIYILEKFLNHFKNIYILFSNMFF
jgi:hypothetical protein